MKITQPADRPKRLIIEDNGRSVTIFSDSSYLSAEHTKLVLDAVRWLFGRASGMHYEENPEAEVGKALPKACWVADWNHDKRFAEVPEFPFRPGDLKGSKRHDGL